MNVIFLMSWVIGLTPLWLIIWDMYELSRLHCICPLSGAKQTCGVAHIGPPSNSNSTGLKFIFACEIIHTY